MPPVPKPNTSKGTLRGEALAVTGLRDLQRALKQAGDDAGPKLRRVLREIAEDVRNEAQANAPVGDGRSGDPGRLRASIRTSVGQRSVSVYSNADYAYVQDRGGWVGRYGGGTHGATLLKRAEVSAYMTRAVRDSQQLVSQYLMGVLDDIERNFER